MSVDGIGPSTSVLSGQRSTTELHAQNIKLYRALNPDVSVGTPTDPRVGATRSNKNDRPKDLKNNITNITFLGKLKSPITRGF